MALESSSGRGGSEGSCAPVREALPISSEVAPAGSTSPTTTSVDPPPMSTTRRNPGATPAARTPANVRPASSSGVSTRRGQPRTLGDELGQRVGVGRAPGGRGRDRRDDRHPLLVDQRPIAPQHRRGPIERVGAERAGARQVGRQVGQVGPTQRRPVVAAYEQPGRVRAQVDGGAAGHGPSWVGWSRTADPAPDRVVAAGQVPGVVGVEALDALSGPAHAAARRRTGVLWRAARRRAPPRSGRARRRLRRPAPRARPGARRPLPRAARPPRSVPGSPASSGSASACRRRGAARCG